MGKCDESEEQGEGNGGGLLMKEYQKVSSDNDF